VLNLADVDWSEALRRFRSGDDRPVLLDRVHAAAIAAGHPSEVDSVVAEADRCVAGERSYFGYPTVNVGPVVDWHHDPIADYRWPATPSDRIDHRVAPCDPKWIWELNRLQHLPALAQAWLFTGRPHYAEAAFRELDGWLEQNPVGCGIAWRGAFEAGLRAISVAVALQGLRDSPALTEARFRRVVRMLDASARYCWHAQSRFSSANNHLVGEMAGLAVVHLLLPELAAPAELFEKCIAILAAEADRQILPDGAGAEQSVAYQIFTVELMSIVIVLLRLRGDDVPRQLADAVARSSRYLAGLVGEGDPDPRYGDDDDGVALRLGVEPKESVRRHLGITAALAGTATTPIETTLTAAWYARASGADLETILRTQRPVHANFFAPHGGLVVLRSGGRRLTMDVGPLGYLSIAAHGHADALAVTLSAQGADLIVDPGTASYYGNPQWRTAHRSTRAHPTVCVDGLDQSVMAGAFLWSRHAECRVRSVDIDGGVVDAEHDGYRRLDDPVIHRRWLIARPDDPTIAVIDLVDGAAEHDAVVSWPLAPGLDVCCTGEGHDVMRAGEPVLGLRYAATRPLWTEQVRADTHDHLGWFSDRLESRTPSWLLGVRCAAVAPVTVLTLIRTGGDIDAIRRPAITVHSGRTVATWEENGVARELIIDRIFSGAIVRGPFPSSGRTVDAP
jgi:hypothetical protein